jgi:hypothetical protein
MAYAPSSGPRWPWHRLLLKASHPHITVPGDGLDVHIRRQRLKAGDEKTPESLETNPDRAAHAAQRDAFTQHVLKQGACLNRDAVLVCTLDTLASPVLASVGEHDRACTTRPPWLCHTPQRQRRPRSAHDGETLRRLWGSVPPVSCPRSIHAHCSPGPGACASYPTAVLPPGVSLSARAGYCHCPTGPAAHSQKPLRVLSHRACLTPNLCMLPPKSHCATAPV